MSSLLSVMDRFSSKAGSYYKDGIKDQITFLFLTTSQRMSIIATVRLMYYKRMVVWLETK